MELLRVLVGVLLLVGLTGCDSKLSALTDNELQDKMYQCNGTSEPSPGFAIACDNYRRECMARREQGRFAC